MSDYPLERLLDVYDYFRIVTKRLGITYLPAAKPGQRFEPNELNAVLEQFRVFIESFKESNCVVPLMAPKYIKPEAAIAHLHGKGYPYAWLVEAKEQGEGIYAAHRALRNTFTKVSEWTFVPLRSPTLRDPPRDFVIGCRTIRDATLIKMTI